MGSAKAAVLEVLDALPEDATYEDIQYAIRVRQKIEWGIRDTEEGRIISDAELRSRAQDWMKPR